MNTLSFLRPSQQEIKREAQTLNFLIDLILITILFALMTASIFVSASGGQNLLEYTKNNTLTGRNYYIAKYLKILIFVVQIVITVCGFVMICLKISTFAIDACFLVNPRFWKRVHEAKDMCKQRGRGNQDSTGFQKVGDILAWLAGWIIPDFYAGSQYYAGESGNGMNGGYQTANSIGEDGYPTLLDYCKDNFGMTVVTLLVAGVLFSGKLLELGGNCADGLTAIVDKALTIDVRGKVNNVMESNKQYAFMYNTSETLGKKRSMFANSMYSQVKGAISDNNTQEFYNRLGKGVDAKVKEIMASKETELSTENFSYVNGGNPSLNFSMQWNENETLAQESTRFDSDSGTWIIPFKDVLGTASGEVSALEAKYRSTAVLIVRFYADQIYDTEETTSSSESEDAE